MYQKASSTLAHLKEVYEYCKRFGVANKIYICPLTAWREIFFTGGLMFSCLLDHKVKDVFAAGGRYDGLIKEHRPKTGSHFEERHAVGFSLNWEKLSQAPAKTTGKAFLKKAADEEAQGIVAAKRCDVLVASFDPALLRSTAVEILRTLWAHDISAELARDARSPEELVPKNREDAPSWIVMVKQDVLKMRSVGKKDVPDVDIPPSQLLNWLRAQINEREARPTAKSRVNVSSEQSNLTVDREHEQEVRILVAQTKSKKFNRQTVVEQAQVSAARLVKSFLDGPIAAIETTDQVVELIRGTCLSDAESWRKVEQSVTTAEKKYVGEIQEMLSSWRWQCENEGGSRHAFVYNFRTGNCVYYDLGA